MKKYRNKDYTYVIITDGDMNSIFDDIDLWNYFKEKIAVVGFLDKTIKEHAPHNVDVLAEIAKSKGYRVSPNESIREIVKNAQIAEHDFYNNKMINPIIVKSVNGVMQLVKNRLR